MTDVAQAVVPGHVTGFFAKEPDEDPTVAGSIGAGLALSEGVTVSVRPAEEFGVVLNGEGLAMEAVERVCRTLDARVEVRGVTDLPLGAGFGVSGAMALGAALATNALYGRALSTNELVTVAHGAEVQAGTGLGDVVAQARGGATLRLEPGGPHENVLDGIPDRARVEYHVIGQRSTDAILSGDTAALDRAGTQALSDLVESPTLATFMEASRRYAREADLLTDPVRRVIQDVSAAGGSAAMAMLGETVFALGSGLSDAGYEATACDIDLTGARLERGPA
jgi:pantoate kinase